MPTYNIYFQNNYGESQTYAFFTEPPKVSSDVGDPKVYSNVWISKKLSGSGGNISIKTTNDFYAWCGTAPRAIAPGVVVSTGHGQLATLGTVSAPGSTFTIFNDDASPSFDGTEKFTSSPACYEIDTGTDFVASQNFLMGLGAYDSSGRMVPSASFAAPRNAKVNIAPIVKFYVAAYNAVQGTTIDYQSVSKNAGVIDFSSGAGRGMFGAVVTQDEYGVFRTTYVPQAQYSDAVSTVQSSSGPDRGAIEAQIQNLQLQVNEIKRYLDMPTPNLVNNYKGSLSWFGPPPPNWAGVYAGMQAGLMNLGYTMNGPNNPDPLKLDIYFSGGQNLATATADWTATYKNSLYIGSIANQGVTTTKSFAIADRKKQALEYLKNQEIDGFATNGQDNGIEA